MAKKAAQPQKKREPPAAGKGTAVQVRMQPDELAAIDAWIASRGERRKRPEAIRQLIQSGLLANKAGLALERIKLVFLVGSLKEILEMTLAEAVRSKGSDGPRWLEQYESELILSAKQNTHSQGLSYEDEAKTVSGLIDLLKYIFAVARGDLAKRGKNG
jgi:hypothetical protein